MRFKLIISLVRRNEFFTLASSIIAAEKQRAVKMYEIVAGDFYPLIIMIVISRLLLCATTFVVSGGWVRKKTTDFRAELWKSFSTFAANAWQ
jgi:hypothetical protein